MAGEHGIALAVIGGLGDGRWFWNIERGADAGKLSGTARIGEKAEMADAAEAFGQDVHEKPAHELTGIERHRFRLAPGAIVFPAEADAAVVAIKETAVGDCDAMSIAAEIIENLIWTAERALGVDDPCDRRSPGKENGNVT